MDDKMSKLRAQRDFLEGRLLALEQLIEQSRPLRLAALAGEARHGATDLAVGVDGLLARLATVNTQLAAMRGAPG